MDRVTRRSLVWLAALGIIALAASATRGALDLAWSADSVRDAVNGFGAWGPALYVALVAFRVLLFVPSQILLVAGGLCFGAAAGALYGALGMVLSGTWLFATARYAGREAVLANVPRSLHWAFSSAGSRAGAAVVFVGTGYPVGPVSAIHAGAGLTSMLVPVFLGAVAAGASIRAATYAYFGSALVGSEGWRILVACALVAAVAALPLAHPRGRAWLRRQIASPADAKPPGRE